MNGQLTRSVVEACYAAWAARDLQGVLDGIAPNCIYTLHVPTDVVHFGGVHCGRPAIRTCLSEILREYGFLAYAVDHMTVEDDTVRAQVVFYYQHMESGQQLDGRFRHVWRVDGAKVVSIDEFHDVALLRAFLEMVRGLRAD